MINKNSKYKKILGIILSVFIFILIPTTFIHAVCDPKTGLDTATGKICYVALEQNAFPGVDQPSASNLNVYLGQIFNFGIAAAVALALIMIIWGGIIKMTTDSWNKQDEANSKIQNALWGLGLALISWILLYTINPELVTFKNNTLLKTPTTTSTTDNTSIVCSDCIDISTIGVACKNSESCRLDNTLATELANALSGQDAWVTEAYPPTVDHISTCHTDGTCADVNLTNGSTDPNKVLSLYNSLESAGLSAVYEVPIGTSCTPYTDIGVSCTSYETTIGQAFHVQ